MTDPNDSFIMLPNGRRFAVPVGIDMERVCISGGPDWKVRVFDDRWEATYPDDFDRASGLFKWTRR